MAHFFNVFQPRFPSGQPFSVDAMARTVFISSTHDDLVAHRTAVRERLLEAGFIPLAMETMGARSDRTYDACVQDVGRAEFFVGIYAWRYGWVPPGLDESITELELRAAEFLERPILCFFVNSSIPWPEQHREGGEGGKRLAELKQQLRRERPVKEFNDENDLAAKVVASLSGEVARAAESSPEGRRLIDLWKTVKRFWIEEVLDLSVPKERRLQLSWTACPEAVGGTVLPANQAAKSLLSTRAKPIPTVFRRQGRKLLILGPPGAGKSTALLQVAEELGRLVGCPDASIPVVLHLGSWDEHLSFDLWMAREVADQYGVAKEDAANWVAQDQLLPLLDGLDEVRADCRHDCTKAINDYLSARGQRVHMAVCSHSEVYGELPPPRLRNLASAITLGPLTWEQVDRHLAAGGSALAGLREALARSPKLRELAASPSLLSLLEQACRDSSPDEIAVRSDEEILWRCVDSALGPGPVRGVKDTPRKLPYPPDAARRILAWLARKMGDHNPSLFQVERLQPSWLGSRARIWEYALVSRAFGGALLALPLAWIYRSTGLFVLLLVLGLLCGGLAGGLDAPGLRRRAMRLGDRARPGLRRQVLRGILVAAAVALAIPLLGTLWLRFLPGGVTGLGKAGADFRNLVKAAVFLAPVFGLVFGSRGAGRDGDHDIRVTEDLVWRRWAWRRAWLGGIWGAATGMALSSAGALVDRTLPHFPPLLWLFLFLAFTILGAVTGGAVGALGGRPFEKRLRPNRGTWLGLKNAGKVALWVALPAAVTFLLFRGASAWALAAAGAGKGIRWRDIAGALEGGLALGVWMGLWFSGLDFVQHFTLRGVLTLTEKIPWRLVRFLGYARDRGLLRRPGRSYKFSHALVRQYLAGLAEPATGKQRGRRRRATARRAAPR